MTEEHDEGLAAKWYERKSQMMAAELGEEHDVVMHALIPFAVGGTLDLYYFPNGIEGTAIATKELSELPGEGSSSDVFENYELVMFTRHPLSLDEARDGDTPFGRAHRNINAILNCIALYSGQAALNPHETCEFPEEMDTVGGRCLVLDAYGSRAHAPEFGLLVLIEVFRSEMEFARRGGGEKLIAMLKEAGYYPYSDLDRPAVM